MMTKEEIGKAVEAYQKSSRTIRGLMGSLFHVGAYVTVNSSPEPKKWEGDYETRVIPILCKVIAHHVERNGVVGVLELERMDNGETIWAEMFAPHSVMTLSPLDPRQSVDPFPPKITTWTLRGPAEKQP